MTPSSATRCARRSAAMAARSPRCAPTISPPCRSRRCASAMPRSIGRSSTRSIFGCANQAGEDNRNVARMALLLAGLPASVPGVTLNRLCASGMEAVGTRRARDPRRRDRVRHRRRRRIDDARAFRAGQGRRSLFAQGRNLRHHHRLAFHQPADEGAIRRRFDAGNRRERGRGIPGQPRRPGRFRAALAAARRQGDRGGLFRRGDRRGRDRRPQGNGEGRQGRASARDHARAARQAQDAVPQSRHGDRRQRLRRQ